MGVTKNDKPEDVNRLTPPASEGTNASVGDNDSELSELDEPVEPRTAPATTSPPAEDDETRPDHYWEGGKIPIFKPTMEQFRSFKDFIAKIDKYGMKSGIVKVIPPKEWIDSLPQLDEMVKTIKVKNPITQEFHGSHGTYTQANIEKQRSYNLPQWKALCEESNHQPPARRGERRRNQEKVVRGGAATRGVRRDSIVSENAEAPAPQPTRTSPAKTRGRGRGRGRGWSTPRKTTRGKSAVKQETDADGDEEITVQKSKAAKVKAEDASDVDHDSPTKGKGSQPKSVASRRKHNRGTQAEVIDEAAFKDFDYHIHNHDDYTTERCQELEAAYWKGLTFNNPMYGADMPGSLFKDSTESWNVAHLENLLDVLGQKVPGVNTAYLYLGMWKATFAWHLEDVDLYSINYIHFGAPKFWYSISQSDARRFEAAMKTIWPNDAKNCDQFLRHKTYLISPQILKSQFNIEVNRLVHYEGEFVITYPYGYHSGFNLGYNCAESVNFATEAWLDYGKVARKCNCEADSVWVDVYDIERKLRGETTPFYVEETDDSDADIDTGLPSPPGSVKGKPVKRGAKRKRGSTVAEKQKDEKKAKKIRIRLRGPIVEPCVLCPNDPPFEPLIPTDDGRSVHRICAEYTPETWLETVDGQQTAINVGQIPKARLELKCNYCRNKRGAVFQCHSAKCTRAYHATCAAAAGVQVDEGEIPVFGEDGTEYIIPSIDFRCRFHRARRPKFADELSCTTSLESSSVVKKYGKSLKKGDSVQIQYYKGEIFAGYVLENRVGEESVLIDVYPKRDRFEVEWKWLLIFDKANSHLPKPSEKAIPLPDHMAHNKAATTNENPTDDRPKVGDEFTPGSEQKWDTFQCETIERNPEQTKVDLDKKNQLWHYLGHLSSDAKACYTGDVSMPLHDTASNFLDLVKPPVVHVPRPVPPPRPLPATSYPVPRTIPPSQHKPYLMPNGQRPHTQTPTTTHPPMLSARTYPGPYSYPAYARPTQTYQPQSTQYIHFKPPIPPYLSQNTAPTQAQSTPATAPIPRRPSQDSAPPFAPQPLQSASTQQGYAKVLPALTPHPPRSATAHIQLQNLAAAKNLSPPQSQPQPVPQSASPPVRPEVQSSTTPSIPLPLAMASGGSIPAEISENTRPPHETATAAV